MNDVGVEEIVQQTPGISQTRFKTQISDFKHGKSSLQLALGRCCHQKKFASLK